MAQSALRLGSGWRVASKLGPRPELPIVLYEYEACPWSRRVREAMTMLDLDAEIRPCPIGGERYRGELIARAGRSMYPYMIDPNSGEEMYEAAEIVHYLYERYGATPVPALVRGPLGLVGSIAARIPRPMAGSAVPSRPPEQLLELYSFEASPYCRLVREALCSLELPYLLHNVGQGSPRRKQFVARSGRMMVPYLADPNKGVEMFESADIIRYLFEQYAV